MTARRLTLLLIPALTGLGALAATPARASQIDISPFVDSDLRGGGYTNGTMYPVGNSTVTIGAVSFKLAPIAGDPNGTGVIQYDTGEPDRIIPIGEIGVTTVYTLINSGFGSEGTHIGSLIFTGLTSGTFVYDLVEGSNVRDHFQGFFVNTLNSPDIYGTALFGDGSVRLDAQRIVLPASFASDTLVSITFAGDPSHSFADGIPFLAAVNTAAAVVPEPASWAMMIAGFGVAGAGLRFRRRAQHCIGVA